MVYNGYYKVMSNIPKMGQLPTPVYMSYSFSHMFPVVSTGQASAMAWASQADESGVASPGILPAVAQNDVLEGTPASSTQENHENNIRICKQHRQEQRFTSRSKVATFSTGCLQSKVPGEFKKHRLELCPPVLCSAPSLMSQTTPMAFQKHVAIRVTCPLVILSCAMMADSWVLRMSTIYYCMNAHDCFWEPMEGLFGSISVLIGYSMSISLSSKTTSGKNMAHLVDWIPAAEITVERQVWLVAETQWPKMPEQLELVGGNHG